LIEATSDEVIDDTGNKISYQLGQFFEDINGNDIDNVDKIESNMKNIRYKKMKILRDEKTGEFNIEDLFKE
jgi:hypothetical protein